MKKQAGLLIGIFIAAVTVSYGSSIQDYTPCTQMGDSAYCNVLFPQLMGTLFYSPQNPIGGIRWLSHEAETDAILYFGPVIAPNPSWFYVPGLAGYFSLQTEQTNPPLTLPAPSTAVPEPSIRYIFSALLGIWFGMYVWDRIRQRQTRKRLDHLRNSHPELHDLSDN
jgi:hypothetical protein